VLSSNCRDSIFLLTFELGVSPNLSFQEVLSKLDTDKRFTDAAFSQMLSLLLENAKPTRRMKNLKVTLQQKDNSCLLFSNKKGVLKQIIPESHISSIIESVHSPKERHLSIRETFMLISQQYEGISRFMVKAFVDRCPNCITQKPVNMPSAPLRPVVARALFEHLQFDFIDMKAKLGPVKGLVYDDRQVYRLISNKEVLAVIKQQKEYVCYPWRYIGVSSDCAGKLRWLAAFRSKIGEDPADLLNNHVFQVLGPPEIFQTDNGGENVNISMRKVLSTWLTQHRRGRPYHPQSQGQRERDNATVVKRICQYLEGHPEATWVDALPHVGFALNQEISSVNQCTPYEFTFGHKHRLTTDEDGRLLPPPSAREKLPPPVLEPLSSLQLCNVPLCPLSMRMLGATSEDSNVTLHRFRSILPTESITVSSLLTAGLQASDTPLLNLDLRQERNRPRVQSSLIREWIYQVLEATTNSPTNETLSHWVASWADAEPPCSILTPFEIACDLLWRKGIIMFRIRLPSWQVDTACPGDVEAIMKPSTKAGIVFEQIDGSLECVFALQKELNITPVATSNIFQHLMVTTGRVDPLLGGYANPQYGVRERALISADKMRQRMIDRFNAKLSFTEFNQGDIVGVYIPVALRKKCKVGRSILPAVVFSKAKRAGSDRVSISDSSLFQYQLRTLYGQLSPTFKPWELIRLPAGSFPLIKHLGAEPMPVVTLEQAVHHFGKDRSPEAVNLANLAVPSAIVDEKELKEQVLFKIRWKGYDENSDTWEDASLLQEVEEFEHIITAWRTANAAAARRWKRGGDRSAETKRKRSQVDWSLKRLSREIQPKSIPRSAHQSESTESDTDTDSASTTSASPFRYEHSLVELASDIKFSTESSKEPGGSRSDSLSNTTAKADNTLAESKTEAIVATPLQSLGTAKRKALGSVTEVKNEVMLVSLSEIWGHGKSSASRRVLLPYSFDFNGELLCSLMQASDTTQNCLLLLVGKTVSVNGTRHNQGAQVRLQFGDLLCFGDDKSAWSVLPADDHDTDSLPVKRFKEHNNETKSNSDVLLGVEDAAERDLSFLDAPRTQLGDQVGVFTSFVNKANPTFEWQDINASFHSTLWKFRLQGKRVAQLYEEAHTAVPLQTAVGSTPFFIGSHKKCDLCINDIGRVPLVCMRVDCECGSLTVTPLTTQCSLDFSPLEPGQKHILYDGCIVSPMHSSDRTIAFKFRCNLLEDSDIVNDEESKVRTLVGCNANTS